MSGIVLNFEQVANARDLGGLPTVNGKHIKKGMLLRSANLSKATENDVKKLQSLNLKLVCDLRTEYERTSDPDVEIFGAKNVWFNVLGSLPKQANSMTSKNSSEKALKMAKAMNPNSFSAETAGYLVDYVSTGSFDGMMENLYVDLVVKENAQKEYARFFDNILKLQGGTVLWHCTQGKDRTGLASVFVLAALGVDRTVIVQDFERSNSSYEGMLNEAMKVAEKKGASELHKGILKAMLGVNAEYLQKAIDYMNANYGSIVGYMKAKLGMTDEIFLKLQKYYLE